jgi:hypothetical protein
MISSSFEDDALFESTSSSSPAPESPLFTTG